MRFIWLLALAGRCLSTRTAMACDEFHKLEMTQAQQLLTQLRDPKSDTMARVFAFQALACADIPAVRQVAMKEALAINGDAIVRGEVLQEILMQRDGIVIELIPPPDASQATRKWIDAYKGSISYNFVYKDARAGCINHTYAGDTCRKSDMLKLNADKVTVYDGALVGEFQLEPDNTMRGYVKPDQNHARVPAKFSLF
jgi:hypothetical protein